MHRRHILVFLGACLSATGCTTLTPNLGEIFSVSNGPVAEQSQQAAPPSPELAPPSDIRSFIVEMRGTNNESQKFKRPLTDQPIYVQEVLVQSNAVKHFGRVKLELWRPRPDGQGYHKLSIPYDRKAKAVPPGYDYQVREGDRLIFMQDDSSILDDMLGSLGG